MGSHGNSVLKSGGPLPAAQPNGCSGSPLRFHSVGRPLFAYSLNEMRTRGCRVKPIGEILRFVDYQSFSELHDAHRVRRYAIIGKHEFSDPEIAAADNSPDRKTFLFGWTNRLS